MRFHIKQANFASPRAVLEAAVDDYLGAINTGRVLVDLPGKVHLFRRLVSGLDDIPI